MVDAGTADAGERGRSPAPCTVLTLLLRSTVTTEDRKLGSFGNVMVDNMVGMAPPIVPYLVSQLLTT